MKQEDLITSFNFDYYLPGSPRDLELFAPQTSYLEPAIFHKMVDSAVVLYRLVERLVHQYLEQPGPERTLLLPDFPLKKAVLELGRKLPPFFWVRYDAFERADGGVFFAEFNYDKPSLQREIIISDLFNPDGNPNRGFIDKFRHGISNLWTKYGNGNSQPRVGMLFDPNHYDEAHLAYLFADLLMPLGYPCSFIGGRNLRVTGDKLIAFKEPLDLVLHQYPTEFSHEINNYAGLLKLYERGLVLLLNDPRAIIPQAKSFFAYLWDLLQNHPAVLSCEEKAAIKETIPYTRMFVPADASELRARREQWVLKSVFGRYSEAVYIGSMMNDREWNETLNYVIQSAQPHIMQEFVPIKRRVVSCYNGKEFENAAGFGNYGIYFTCGEFAGTCVRWSTDYLSHDDTVWFTPVGVRTAPPEVLKIKTLRQSEGERRALWQEIALQAAFQYDYTRVYTGEWESFSIDPVVLTSSIYNELASATEALARVFQKARVLVQQNFDIFGPILGLPEQLGETLKNDHFPWLTFFGRLDWVVDKDGRLRLLELNTDTPGGLESIGLNNLLAPYCPDLKDPNRGLAPLIAGKFCEYNKTLTQPVGTLGMVACAGDEEDWSILRQMGSILDFQVERLVYGDISALGNQGGSMVINGQRLDGLFRYYPLDWLLEDRRGRSLLTGLANTCCLNPPCALIPQSKAFLALVWQLLQEDFYTPGEKQLIERYLVPTYLSWTGGPCIIKPYLEREGQGVLFSKGLSREEMREIGDRNVVYQELVDIKALDIESHTSYKRLYQVVYPILGAFMVADQFAGLYTRLGSRITDRYAVVGPTFVEE